MTLVLATPGQLGHLLLSARRRKKMTQVAAAAHIGISQSRLSVLEADPSGLTVEQLLAMTALYGLRIAVEDRIDADSAAHGPANSGVDW